MDVFGRTIRAALQVANRVSTPGNKISYVEAAAVSLATESLATAVAVAAVTRLRQAVGLCRITSI